MSKEEKPKLKVVKQDKDLTIKQRQFVDEIIKGKLGSYKEAYAKVYDVELTKTGKIPKWVEVEASRLVANPKIALSIQKAIQKKSSHQLLHRSEQETMLSSSYIEKAKKRIAMHQEFEHWNYWVRAYRYLVM